ncbi:Rotatin, partial [Armadillidium nasatum]
HPLLEVQIRSLQSILQKLENEVCSVKDLLQYRTFIPNLIGLLKSDLVLLRIHTINLLRLLLKDREAQITFKSQDGERVLQKIAIELPVPSKCKEISSSSGEQHIFDAESVEEAYVLNASNNQSSTSCGNSLINGYGPFSDSSLNAQEFHNIQNPILFLTFPWVPLFTTSVDLKVLDSAGQSVANATEAVFPFILFDCQNVLFKDYPIEIFLQRPFIIKVLLGYLITDSTEHNDKWRQQEMVCSVIGTFMSHLFSRIKDYELAYKNPELSNVLSKDSFNDQTDSARPLSCCFNSFSRSLAKQSLSKGELSQPSVETLHESDDIAMNSLF